MVPGRRGMTRERPRNRYWLLPGREAKSTGRGRGHSRPTPFAPWEPSSHGIFLCAKSPFFFLGVCGSKRGWVREKRYLGFCSSDWAPLCPEGQTGDLQAGVRCQSRTKGILSPKEVKAGTRTGICTPVFTAAQFTTAKKKRWEQLKRPLMEE